MVSDILNSPDIRKLLRESFLGIEHTGKGVFIPKKTYRALAIAGLAGKIGAMGFGAYKIYKHGKTKREEREKLKH
jgi:hypothetical protein